MRTKKILYLNLFLGVADYILAIRNLICYLNTKDLFPLFVFFVCGIIGVIIHYKFTIVKSMRGRY